ncbi:MAG: DUF4333 domain-containing protein [Rhodococcus sp. (in: high G+C Gram-positive bacteria)]|nr:DUF4333 domain-containing protein [Rhodococcus sp. (in: high G+C Gram-positive bacteria)]
MNITYRPVGRRASTRPARVVLLSMIGTAALALAACTTTEPGTPNPQTSDNGLIVANSNGCATLGWAVLEYLSTGENRGDPTLDLKYGDSVGVALPQARAIADRAIVDCDRQNDVSDGDTGSATTRTLDQTSAEDGVRKVVTDSYGAASVSNVQCPKQIPVVNGTSVDCSLTIDGADKLVTLTFIGSDGDYEVSLPK